ncbi:thiamine-phosphate kinase [Catenovulum sp. SM1970]|uniref:thiamine-phosphate kinase n=1 Tax=Marinifaba aquimaris TaxID=2741323 RepID=UPI001571FDFB|nr:thiamine-phosphate kinase [Marinifaba aquimaris]NTS77060.1 thiamine-phosphate kinase [Marinifaba aquimaris]
MQEFDVIARFFSHQNSQQNASSAGVLLDKGDDCALLQPSQGKQLAISTDTLVADVHFFADMSAHSIAHRALASNLSDLAAMGAKPKWFSLALTLPSVDETWLAEFSRGLFELADLHGIYLTGGDTTKGPLAISITVIGEVNGNTALKRNNAKPDDLIAVTNQLGDAAAALQFLPAKNISQLPLAQQNIIAAYQYPKPQLDAGQALLGIANSALDISDGLLADLQHICAASQLSAQISLDKLPLSDDLIAQFGQQQAIRYAATGGDDYQLCFTFAKDKLCQLTEIMQQQGIHWTVIGSMKQSEQSRHQVKCTLDEQPFEFDRAGYQHFSEDH